MHRGILGLITTPQDNNQEKAQKAELARETLQHLELTGADAKEDKAEQGVGLYADVEAFRMRYFEQKSDIKGFVRKIAEQCPGDNGQVDVIKLQKRLEAIKPILIAFGDQSVNSLVEDFAVSFGLLTQKREGKAVVAREAKSKLQPQTPIGPEKWLVYEKLIQKQIGIEQPAVTGRDEQARPAEERGEEAQEPGQLGEPGTERAEEQGGEERPQEPVAEPQTQAQHQPTEQPTRQQEGEEERVEFTQAIKDIEEELSEEVGEEIKLTPEQIRLVRDKHLHPDAFTNTYYGLQEIFEDEDEEKSHNEIMQELEKLLNALTIRGDGERQETVYVTAKGNRHLFYL